MKGHIHLLQIELYFHDYRFALFCFVSAFVTTLFIIPPIISLVKKYKLYDIPNERKEHVFPVPTLGGIAIVGGMILALLLWFPFNTEPLQVCFFFSIAILFGIGIMDDLKDMPAKYKFIIQVALATLIATSGIRITSFDGLFGINDMTLFSQYLFTVLAIVGVTNAFNLIDGIDGLAGGLGFMSLITLGMFLTLSGDPGFALIAFALAGAILAFLYFNFNPAKIFMGDTGSLVLGFVVSVLCIRLLQINTQASTPMLPHAALFVFGIVLIPVFDTIRVFAFRIWKGKSPFVADRTHIHHLLTNNGFGHVFAVRVICFLHAVILIEIYLLRGIRQEVMLLFLFLFMTLATIVLKHSKIFLSRLSTTSIIKDGI